MNDKSIMKIRGGSIKEGVGLACITASPIFTVAIFLYMLIYRWMELRSVTDVAEMIWVMVVYSAIGLPIGAIIAAPLSTIGGTTMCALADRYALARHPIFWTMAGAAIGLSIALPLPARLDTLRFGLVVTSAMCARIGRSRINWVDDESPYPLDVRDR